jgi:hypothetical protein
MKHIKVNSTTHQISINNFSPTIWNVYHLASALKIPAESFQTTKTGIILKTAREDKLIDTITYPSPSELLGHIKRMIEPLKDPSEWTRTMPIKRKPPSREETGKTLQEYKIPEIEKSKRFLEKNNISLESMIELENKIKEIRDKYNQELEQGLLTNIRNELQPIKERLDHYQDLWQQTFNPEEILHPETGEPIPRDVLLEGPGKISPEDYEWEKEKYGPNITTKEIRR